MSIQMHRGHYRTKYRQEALDNALKAVRSDGMSHASAAKRFGVPRTTLIDRLKGRIEDDVAMGAKTVLTAEEEKTLCDFIVRSAKSGFPLQRVDVRRWVKHIMDLDKRRNPFKGNLPGQYVYFLQHQTFNLVMNTTAFHLI